MTKASFSDQDRTFMKLAVEEAKLAFDEGNYPCGAVVTVDNKIVGKAHNLKETRADRVSHAEMLLYIKHSSELKQAVKDGKTVTMYTTLEPCLMCFGAAAMHRVNRVVAASPDPYGDMSKIVGKDIGAFYANSLPKLEYGLCIKKANEIAIEFLKQKGGDDSKKLIKELNRVNVGVLDNEAIEWSSP